LKTVTNDGLPTERYTYDEVGNRTSGPNASISYVYSQGNQLDSQTGATYQYDDYGNLTKKIQGSTSYSYAYDGENRLIRVEKKSGSILASTTSFDYDPFGRRIKRSVLKAATQTINRYIYDGDNILYEYDGTDQLARRITHYPGSIDTPIAYNTNTSAYFYFNDALGSVNYITGQDGTTVAEYSYDSFGSPTKTRLGSMPQPYSYTGREYDSETGLYYYRARYYDPKIGRFIQRDPIGFAGGDVNLYGYVQNNPVNWRDPSGKSGIPGAIIGGISGAAGGFTSGLINGDGSLTGAVFGGLAGGLAGVAVGAINPIAGSAAGEAMGAIAGGLIGGATGGAVSSKIDCGKIRGRSVQAGALTGALTGTIAAPGVALAATVNSPLTTSLMGAMGGMLGDTVGATGILIYNYNR
jgi:RHS repeat-associated protein